MAPHTARFPVNTPLRIKTIRPAVSVKNSTNQPTWRMLKSAMAWAAFGSNSTDCK